MKFYCVRCKKAFNTEDYRTVKKSGRKFAVAKHSCAGGKTTEAYRIMGKA